MCWNGQERSQSGRDMVSELEAWYLATTWEIAVHLITSHNGTFVEFNLF